MRARTSAPVCVTDFSKIQQWGRECGASSMLHAAGLMRQLHFSLPLQMGRQAVAGLNPFTIQLAPLHLFKGVSTITAKHLNGVHPHCLATQMSRQGRGGTDWTLTTVLLVACSIHMQAPDVAALCQNTSCSACGRPAGRAAAGEGGCAEAPVLARLSHSACGGYCAKGERTCPVGPCCCCSSTSHRTL